MKDEANFLLRMRGLGHVPRWATYPSAGAKHESVAEHSFHVALIVLVLCKRTYHEVGGLMAAMALLHDAEEASTGDLLSLVKRFVPKWGEVEAKARQEVFGQNKMFSELCRNSKEYYIIKVADCIAALMYASEQVRLGNSYFVAIEAECLGCVYTLVEGYPRDLHDAIFELVHELGYTDKVPKDRPAGMTHHGE